MIILVLALLREYHCPVTDTDYNGWVALHHACAGGSLKLVQILLREHKADVNARSHLKETPLHMAAKSGKFKVALYLISEFGCDPNVVGYNGQTLLHYACNKGTIDLVCTLIREHKADINARNNLNETPLHVAAESGKFDMALGLVSEFGCDPNVAGRNGQTLLHYACETGTREIVCTLIREHKADVNACNSLDDTPLHVAADSGKFDMVLHLVREFGCDPNVQGYNGQTLLHYACEWGAVELVCTLIREYKADINAHNDFNKTPLHVAADANEFEIVLSLVEFGCDPNAVSYCGQKLFHYACRKGIVDQVRTLIRHKADVNARNYLNKTPLDVALDADNFEVVLFLINNFGCDPNQVVYNGQTLLHYACKKGTIDLVSALIHKHKADVNARNNRNETPLHVAADSGKFDMALYLVSEFGCDPNIQGYNGQTLLHYACEWGAVELVCTLIREYKADTNACNSRNEKPLHVAVAAANFEVVLSLINEFGCDPNIPGPFGKNPLHMASQRGYDSLVKALLKSASPLLTDDNGNTPLHLASETNRLDCVKLLVHANAPLYVLNDKGETPVHIASSDSKVFLVKYIQENRQKIQNRYSIVLEHAKKKYSGPHYLTRLFVLGNPGAGKSSFIESLKREGFFQSFRKVSKSSVPLHTAGIIPSVFMSREYGRVLFYDFAGDAEYYSSHAAIFESLTSSRKGSNIFIVVVDLRASIEATLHYWFSFVQYQKFNKPLLIVLGSHDDMSTKHSEKGNLLNQLCRAVSHNVHNVNHFMLDCRDPRSNQISQFKKQILTWVSESQQYELSNGASLLLGLLEEDFSAVTACPVQTLLSHIEDSGVWLPEALHQVILELHEVGDLLLLGDSAQGYDHIIFNISKLTNEVHELLFSKSALPKLQEANRGLQVSPLNIGILSENFLTKILPPHITKECLIHLQYCQQISHSDVSVFPSLEQTDSTDKSFLFFPALCSVDKCQVPWDEPSGNSFCIGWMALCTDPRDYFPPRFLHVLLLRLVYRFALSVPTQLLSAHAFPEYSHRCTMWKKGVHWLMEEGVDCMVELVNGNKGVVVLLKCCMDGLQDCIRVFTKVVSCVVEAKAEFCHSIKPQFFLLDSSAEADYMNEDHQFAVSDMERALEFPEGKRVIISVSGRGKMELKKLQYMRKLTLWNNIFPIDIRDILHILRVVVNKVFDLGLCLGAPWEFLEKLKANFPSDVDRRKEELVKWWISSSRDPPCWWTLVEALDDIDRSELAKKIRKEHGESYIVSLMYYFTVHSLIM